MYRKRMRMRDQGAEAHEDVQTLVAGQRLRSFANSTRSILRESLLHILSVLDRANKPRREKRKEKETNS